MASELKQAIKAAMIEAMKAKQKERLGTIRLIQAALKQEEIDNRDVELDDARVLSLLDKMLKQRKESIKQYQSAGRSELAAVEEAEIEIIRSFMPEPLSQDELSKVVREAIEQLGASSIKDMGKVMAQIKPTLQGRCDMSEVSQLIKSSLTQTQ